MATWLACDEIDFNAAISVASGWVGRAHRLLDPLDPSPDHGWLHFHEGYLARHRGDGPLAIELGSRAAAIGSEFGVPDLEMLGLALRGATLVFETEVEEGMRCLDEAALLALQGEAVNAASGTWALCFTVVSCSAARDYERAFEWCDRATRIAEEGGSRYLVACAERTTATSTSGAAAGPRPRRSSRPPSRISPSPALRRPERRSPRSRS